MLLMPNEKNSAMISAPPGVLPCHCQVPTTDINHRAPQQFPASGFKSLNIQFNTFALSGVVQLVGASSCNQGFRFSSWSGHIPRLMVRCPVQVPMIPRPSACSEGNQLMLLSLIDVFLSPFLLL